jgi:CheY-like chemotaxis protein
MEKLLHILLADDDNDDRFFFEKVLKQIPIPAQLTSIEDGEKLMELLIANYKKLPDVLFLDLNMPRKNGSECLMEIKQSKKLKDLPVIIYSTSLSDDIADHLYNNGAHYYIRKADIMELKKVLHYILRLLWERRFTRPAREKFVLTSLEKHYSEK